MTTLQEIVDAVYMNADVHGFHQTQDMDRYMGSILNNCHAELSELWDAWRTDKLFSSCDKMILMDRPKMEVIGSKSPAQPNERMSCAEEEIADIIIRMLDLSKVLNIDILQAIQNKHEYNTKRPFMHGKRN